MDGADQTSPFLEVMAPALADRLRAVLLPGETVRLRVAADLQAAGAFGQPWLVATQQRLLLLGTDGADDLVEVPLAEIAEVRVQGLVGGGCLEVERKTGRPVCLYYTGSLAAKFAEVAGGIRQLSKGEALTLPAQIERSRCATCGRLLPEKDGICPFCIAKWDTIKRIAGYLGPYRARVALLIGISLLSTAAELLPPYLVKNIIDDVLTPRAGLALLGWFVLGLLAVRLVSFACELGHGWLRGGLASWVSRDIRSQLYQNLQYLPLRFYDKRKVGALISRFLNDADRLEMFLLFGIPYILTNVLMLVGILGLLLYLSWSLTLYVLLPVPFIIAGGFLIWDRMRHYWGRWSAKWARFASHLNESITGIRVVKAFAQEEREASRFDQRNEELRQINVSAERVWFVFYAVMNFLMSFGVFLVWYFGGRKILGAQLTLGVLMAFISYIWQLYHPLRFFSEINNFTTRAFAGAEKVFEVIDARAEQAQDPQATAMPRLEGRVEFKGATFGYEPAKPVLKEIDLVVEPGEMIGLVGRSGVGKSTLVSLICRFYDVDQGSLLIDGVDIRKIRLEDLRRQIGLVAQESFLFSGTIAENIAYGRPGAAMADIVRAARAANAHEFIVAKPDGYDTLVGERGNKLAGGEKQRVAIARAILHDPRILILDEATASVDTPTEKKIQEAIARLVTGRTTFAIAHRLSTLRSADRLVVLDDGKVAEVGTHAELMAREGIFHNLVKTQQETTAVMAVGGGKDAPA